jgi:hypothetical protein
MQQEKLDSSKLEAAGGPLFDFALDPRNWLPVGRARTSAGNLYRLGTLQVCAAVAVTPTLDTYVRVSFRGPELSPMQAVEHLEALCRGRFPMTPNTEWEVEIDTQRWIHFTRRYTDSTLRA